jgi:hypothetical protein
MGGYRAAPSAGGARPLGLERNQSQLQLAYVMRRSVPRWNVSA